MVKRLFRLRVLVSVSVAAAVVVGALVAGIFLRDGEGEAAAASERPARTTTTTEPPPTTTVPPTTTTIPPPPSIIQPPWANLPPLPPGGVGPGSSGPEVQAYQQRLVDLKFDPGAADGNYGVETRYAVEALQKMYGTEPTGSIGEGELFALAFFKYPEPLVPRGEPKRVEVDIAKQYLTLYLDFQPALITPISSGNGEGYCYVPKSGGRRVCDEAVTPSGRYEFYTRYNGWQDGDLGRMYNPVYWLRGWAIHGMASVPTYPASHGCIRIPMHVAEYFPALISNGDIIYVVGGSDYAPSGVSTPLPGGSPAPAPEPEPAAPPPTEPAPTTPPTEPAPAPPPSSSTSSSTSSTTTTTTLPGP